MTEIKVLDSYGMIGNYFPKQDRVEISKYLKQFPELYDKVLYHELKHAEISKMKGIVLHKHVIHDFKDRWIIFTKEPYRTQFAEFSAWVSPLNSWKEFASAYIYELSALLQIPAMIICFCLRLKDWIKKKDVKGWIGVALR